MQVTVAPYTASATRWESIPAQGYCAELVARPRALYGGGQIQLSKKWKSVYAILLFDHKSRSTRHSLSVFVAH